MVSARFSSHVSHRRRSTFGVYTEGSLAQTSTVKDNRRQNEDWPSCCRHRRSTHLRDPGPAAGLRVSPTFGSRSRSPFWWIDPIQCSKLQLVVGDQLVLMKSIEQCQTARPTDEYKRKDLYFSHFVCVLFCVVRPKREHKKMCSTNETMDIPCTKDGKTEKKTPIFKWKRMLGNGKFTHIGQHTVRRWALFVLQQEPKDDYETHCYRLDNSWKWLGTNQEG